MVWIWFIHGLCLVYSSLARAVHLMLFEHTFWAHKARNKRSQWPATRNRKSVNKFDSFECLEGFEQTHSNQSVNSCKPGANLSHSAASQRGRWASTWPMSWCSTVCWMCLGACSCHTCHTQRAPSCDFSSQQGWCSGLQQGWEPASPRWRWWGQRRQLALARADTASSILSRQPPSTKGGWSCRPKRECLVHAIYIVSAKLPLVFLLLYPL